MNWRSLPRRIADFPAKYRFFAWLSLALIGVATIGPIGLRPTTPFGPDAERFAAFVLVGYLFGRAYPKRPILVAVLLIIACAFFEYTQHLIPSRHPDLGNFLVKSAGAIIGTLVSRFLR